MKILLIQNNLIKVIRCTLFLGIASLIFFLLNWNSIIAHESNPPSDVKIFIFFSFYCLILVFGFAFCLKSPTKISLEGNQLTIYKWIFGVQLLELKEPLETKINWTIFQDVIFTFTAEDRILAKFIASHLLLANGDLPKLNFNQYTPNSEPLKTGLRLKAHIDSILGNEFKSEFC
jgi:hypothetical protein